MEADWWADGGEPVTILATEELWGESVATVAVPSTTETSPDQYFESSRKTPGGPTTRWSRLPNLPSRS